MVFSVSPRKYSTISDAKIANGIEIMTTSVERHEPQEDQYHQRGEAGGNGAFS